MCFVPAYVLFGTPKLDADTKYEGVESPVPSSVGAGLFSNF